MSVFAFRISVPYTDIGLTLLALFDLTEYVAVYEHPADEKVRRTHIHGLLMNCERKEDTLREKFFKPHWKGQYQLATTYKNKDNEIVPVDEGYISYMSKGKYDPEYVKGFTKERLAELKAAWIDMPQVADPVVDTTAPEKKKKDSVCIYDILLRVRDQCHKESRLSRQGNLLSEVVPSNDNFWTMCLELNKARIRTSRNELERAWVTLLRMDEGNSESLFNAINKNVFR